ncbi:hypothetical protein NVS47_09375 [Dehalobacterium formicoaceticum]|uniref:Uncharacterized protein n=1 Tax=Dehalobacterium formicoaceticum TaxID=51515 RepID=A0ABT1Y5D8_9FIRM|nr:hypothetical protein [Dehalobacterium formicoaceticum]MCR6545716.1 hypothetical protein [Dehalobacterium formicoaceticum]
MDNYICMGDLLARWSLGDSILISQNVKTADHGERILSVNNRLGLQLTNISPDQTLVFAFPQGGDLPDIDDTLPHPGYARIYFYFSVGQGENDFLTQQQAENIVCTASPGWTVRRVVDSGRYGLYWGLIPGGEVALVPAASVAVQFDQVACSGDLEKMSLLTTLAKDINSDRQEEGPPPSGQNASGYLPVLKKFSPPYVRRFISNRGSAGILDQVNLEWEALGLFTGCRFLPGADEEGGKAVSQQYQLSYTMTESLAFTLEMTRGGGEVHRAHCSVLVEEPQIISYQADKVKIKYGDRVKLSYLLRDTFHAYINQGIGRVECSPQGNTGVNRGETTVIPTRKETLYTITCLGRDKLLSDSILVTIEDYLNIANLSYYRIPSDGVYLYYLNWKVDNCTQISLTVQGHGDLSGSKWEGSTSFTDASVTPLSLHVDCKGPGGQVYRCDFSPD